MKSKSFYLLFIFFSVSLHSLEIDFSVKNLWTEKSTSFGGFDFSILEEIKNEKQIVKSQTYISSVKSNLDYLNGDFLCCDFDFIFQGQFFPEFADDPAHYADRRFTHVIEPFDIPREWRIYRSYDFGYAKSFSCAWWAVDFDGVIYRILELYGCTDNPDEGVRWTPERQFRRIREIEDTHPYLKGRDIQGVADPAIWDTSRGESIYETALRHRIYFQKGDNRRIAGWMQMHYRLAFDEEGYPMMYVFSHCRAFLRTVPVLLYSDTDPEDLDTKQEDHAADECRYFCMSRPIAPVRRHSGALPVDDPLDLMKKG